MNVLYKAGETRIRTVVKDNKCVYSGEPVDALISDGYKIMNIDEAMPLVERAQEEKYCLPWVEVSAEEWDDCINVLPPVDWRTTNGINMFRMSEMLTGDITAHYARVNGRFFCANRRRSIPHHELTAELGETL